MITFEGDNKDLNARFFSQNSFAFLFVYLLYSFIISLFFKNENLKYYAYFLELILLILFILVTINTSKSIINLVTINENEILLKGEVFNKEWEKSIPLKEAKIEVKGNPSRSGLSGVTFYINLKNEKDKYTINSFQTFSDEQIVEIFNEFKKYKGEKIILDEKLYIMRIQEKIEKCQ